MLNKHKINNMEKNEILIQVQDVFCDILDEESIILGYETTSNDIDGWDSLTHIQLVVAIEKHFKIKFSSSEILSWKNIGEMITSLSVKLN
jgi:acyl carrier protein